MKRINWKLRLKNKATLAALAAAVIACAYQVLDIFNIAPAVSQEETTQAVMVILSIMAAVGIIIDPTTAGISDSERARQYNTPGGGIESKPELPDDYYEREAES